MVKQQTEASYTVNVMRTGQIGEGEKEFSEQQSRIFDEKFRNDMKNMDFDIYKF